MLIKSLELVIILIVISFIFLQIFQISEFIYTSYISNYNFLERFLKGRLIIKLLTESSIFSDNICKLNQNFTYFINKNVSLQDIIKDKEFIDNVRIEVLDLENKEKIFEMGNRTTRYISFSRICYYDGKLVVIKVLV